MRRVLLSMLLVLLPGLAGAQAQIHYTPPVASTPGIAASLGANLITNGDFATGDCTGWTCGANWSAATGALVHTAGAVEAVSQSVTVTSGVTYQIGFDQSATPAGTLAFALGAAAYPATSASSVPSYLPSLTALATGAVTFSITPDTNYNGTLDNITLRAITPAVPSILAGVESNPGTSSVFLGNDAGSLLNGTGHGLVGIGEEALARNTTGGGNAAVGYLALKSNSTGYSNNALGAHALEALTTGYGNSAVGQSALVAATTGYNNMAIGTQAMAAATTGYNNVAIGGLAMSAGVVTGYGNIGIGNTVMNVVAGGAYNVAIGDSAGQSITTGNFTTSVGAFAYQYGGAGNWYNVAIGFGSLKYVAGDANVGIGYAAFSAAGATGTWNVAVGMNAGYKSGATPATANALTTGTSNTFIGYQSGLGSTTQRTNATAIGYESYVDADNTVALGDENVTSVLASSDGGATITAAAIKIGANIGVTGTVVVKGSDGNNCNLVFEGGVLTSETCP